MLNGTTYVGGVADQAHAYALAAYNTLAGEAFSSNLDTSGLSGQALTPGVYQFTSAAQLTGTLILNAEGNPNARFDFQIGSTLTTASNSQVTLSNGAQASNIFWQVGTSATLGTGTNFSGSILADQSITLNTGVDLSGRALALNAAVTLDDNTITTPAAAVPEPAETSALIAGVFLACLLGSAGSGALLPGESIYKRHQSSPNEAGILDEDPFRRLRPRRLFLRGGGAVRRYVQHDRSRVGPQPLRSRRLPVRDL